jgi:ADP-ribosylglycohydrolase
LIVELYGWLIDNIVMEDRIIGSLMGQAVGDALGTRYEFSSASNAKQQVQEDCLPDGHLPMLGDGPFSVRPGQVTDDTELALMVARRLPGVSPVGVMYVAKAFVDWYRSMPFDIGNATRTAFSRIDPKAPVQDIHAKMLQNAQANMGSLSNGCLMKISPIALLGVVPTQEGAVYTDAEIASIAGEICKLTNPNPAAVDACKVYVIAIRNALRGKNRKAIWKAAYTMAATPLVKAILAAAVERASPAPSLDRPPIKVDGSGQGYLGVALQLAFYELIHGKSFEDSLTRTVSRGGDTDTNGCIVGALIGAYYGYSDIPTDWSKTVLNVDNPRTKVLPEVMTRDLLSLALRLGYKD